LGGWRDWTHHLLQGVLLSTKPGYFPALDGLRLLASLNIVLLHLNSSWCLMEVYTWPVIGRIVQGPLFSASLFFVLGGFIYFHLLAPRLQGFSTLRFLKSRIQKLYPLHLFATLLMVIVFWSRNVHQGDIWQLGESALAHLTLLWSFAPETWYSLNEPSWALTSFFLAYAILGWFGRKILLLQKQWQMALLLLGLLVPTVIGMVLWGSFEYIKDLERTLHVHPLLRVCEFFFGMVLARWFQIRKPILRNGIWRDLLIVAGIAISWPILVALKSKQDELNYLSRHVFLLLFYGWMVWHLARNQGWVAKIFAHPWVRFVGKGSFYPYLLHLPMMGLTIIVAKAIGLPGFFKVWWHPIVFVVVLYGLSALYVARKKEGN